MKIEEFSEHVDEEVDDIARELGLSTQGSLEQNVQYINERLAVFGFRDQALEYVRCYVNLLEKRECYPDIARLAAWAYLLAAQHRRDHGFDGSEGICGGVHRKSLEIPSAKDREWVSSPCVTPNCARVFERDIYLARSQDGRISLADNLTDLLVNARNAYAWRTRNSPAESQNIIMALERETQKCIEQLDAEKAYRIVREVSEWGGNNRKLDTLDKGFAKGMAQFESPIQKLLTGKLRDGLTAISNQPGINLVMATKIFRFCCPASAAAVDRHSSYFFNSLAVHNPDGKRTACTQFRREWGKKDHRSSRLATFTAASFNVNVAEYLGRYLPLLAEIAEWLNRAGVSYTCASSGLNKPWRPADVEMAAYHWWSRNGPP